MEYSVRISQFEGPLDLLLHLVSKAEIAIEDIFVSDVTDQYLRYIERMQAEESDMEVMSGFLNMASLLVYIKSRSLLPNENETSETEEDPGLELIERLRLYKAYKDASCQLRDLEADAENIFFKYPEELPDMVSDVTFEDATAASLYEAYIEILKKKKERKEIFRKVAVRHDAFSVRVQSGKIMNVLKANKKVTFSSIFDQVHEPMEIAVTFLALLQLWHARKVNVEQSGQFSEIYITKDNTDD